MPHRTLSSFSRRRWLAGAPLTAMAAMAGTADGNPRLEKLFLAFMAPCCWRENLFTHQSPKADELRAAIRRQVAEGLSDEQIETALVKEFSTRILTHPEGVAGGLLRWTPWAAAAVGGIGLAAFVQRSLRNRPRLETPDGAPLPDIDMDEFDAR